MDNMNYENKILDAVQLLVDSAISKAKYDKTIQGVIVKCTDETKGQYVVSYQNSSFYAYSTDTSSIFKSQSLWSAKVLRSGLRHISS